MSFGGGGGWGGGGGGEEEAGEEEGPTKWWGPAGSGAIITPGQAWEETITPIADKTKTLAILAFLAVLVLLRE